MKTRDELIREAEPGIERSLGRPEAAVLADMLKQAEAENKQLSEALDDLIQDLDFISGPKAAHYPPAEVRKYNIALRNRAMNIRAALDLARKDA